MDMENEALAETNHKRPSREWNPEPSANVADTLPLSPAGMFAGFFLSVSAKVSLPFLLPLPFSLSHFAQNNYCFSSFFLRCLCYTNLLSFWTSDLSRCVFIFPSRLINVRLDHKQPCRPSLFCRCALHLLPLCVLMFCLSSAVTSVVPPERRHSMSWHCSCSVWRVQPVKASNAAFFSLSLY